MLRDKRHYRPKKEDVSLRHPTALYFFLRRRYCLTDFNSANILNSVIAAKLQVYTGMFKTPAYDLQGHLLLIYGDLVFFLPYVLHAEPGNSLLISQM